MMFFNVLGILTEGFYSLTSGIYYFLGNLYTFIVDLATTNFINSSVIEDFVRTIYVLAGVFMLFRVAVSFLNSLIDPDKFTDKNEGASKILTRLVIVVVLMIALTPGSFVYRFLDRLQSAVIGEEGLIVNIIGKADLNVGSAVNKYINDINPFGDMSVDAAGSDRNQNSKVCDYSGVTIENGNKYYRLNIYYGKGCNNKYSDLKKITGKTNSFYKFVTGTDTAAGSGTEIKYILPSNVSSVAIDKDYNIYNKKGNKIIINEPQEVKIKDGVMTLYKKVGDCTGSGCLNSSGTFTSLETGKESGYRDHKTYKLDAGGLFAQNVLNTMASCPDVDDQTSEECTKDLKGNILVDGNQAISDIDDEKLSISWLIAIIVGIVIIVYLAVLCIEVVVRSLKLMLLQMIAPIAIISYVSPRDKVLGQWAKMYASTYLDLFIKLFAIKLGAELISAIKFSGSTIKDLILILGCLVFMKVIPTMISKIFGIDIASGTLKDSMGMLKKGIGVAAGAAIGGVAAGVTGAMAFHGSKGQGFGNRALAGLRSVSSIGAGLTAGALSGSKGKITGGLGVSNKNLATKSTYESGITPTSLLIGATAGKVGMDYASRQDRAMLKGKDTVENLQAVSDIKDNMEKSADGSKFFQDIRTAVSNGDLSLNQEQYELLRDSYIDTQLSGGDRNAFWAKARQLDKNNILSTVNQNDFSDFGTVDFKEVGVRNKLEESLADMKAVYRGNTEIRQTVSKDTPDGHGGMLKAVSTIDNFQDIKSANKITKQVQGEIRKEQNDITRSDKYRLSKAAHDSINGNGGKK